MRAILEKKDKRKDGLALRCFFDALKATLEKARSENVNIDQGL